MISQADIPTALHLQLKVKCHFLWNVTLEFYSQIGISRPPLGVSTYILQLYLLLFFSGT